MVALFFGVIFTVIAIVGFFTPTENGTGVQAVFGLFDVDLIHNILHLITGLLGIGAAFTGQSHSFNRGFGIFYLVFALLALIPALYFPAGKYGTDSGLFLNLTHVNAGDLILYLIAAVIALVVGFFLHQRAGRRAATL